VNKVRARQIGVEYFRKGMHEYDADSLESSLYYFNLSSKFLPQKDTVACGGIFFMRALIYKKFNKLDSAIYNLDEFLATRQAKFSDSIELAFLYGDTKRFKAGLTILENSMNTDSLNPVIYNGMANYSVETGIYKNAIKYAEKGLKLTHDSMLIGALLNNLGYAQAKIISNYVGLETVENSINFSPQNPFAYFNKSRIYHDIGDKGKELFNFMKADSLGGVINCSQGQIKICQKLIRPELEAPYEGKRSKPMKPGRLELVFEEGFSDSAIVLLNDKVIFRDWLKSSSSGVCNKNVEINYSGYNELPRITVTLIKKGESIFFYPVRDIKMAYIDFDGYNQWNVSLSNNSHFYW
jgi:tetratricopeptide (TPR) repeat protein